LELQQAFVSASSTRNGTISHQKQQSNLTCTLHFL